jgi:hypothetical protein
VISWNLKDNYGMGEMKTLKAIFIISICSLLVSCGWRYEFHDELIIGNSVDKAECSNDTHCRVSDT